MSRKHRKITSSKYRKITINHDEINKRIRHRHNQLLVLLFVGIFTLIGGSYAYLTTTKTGDKNAKIVAGTLKINYKDKNEINLDNTYPMSDKEGLNTPAYTFTIENTGNLKGKYEISLEERDENTLDKSNIRYSIKEGNGEWSSPKSLEDGIVIKSNGIVDGGDKVTYQLKLWLKEDAKNEVQGQTYKAKVVVDMVQENAGNITTTNPVIRLNGSNVVRIEQNSTYTEPGVKDIISKEELNVSSVVKRYEYFDGENTITVTGIDTSKVGIYYIYYEITDSKGMKGVATRVVNVTRKNATPPVITLRGDNPVVLDYNEEYIEPGYTSIDDEDGDITSKVIVIGKVNKEQAGTYTIKYISKDSMRNISSATREVIVEKANKDVSMSALRVDNWILTSRIDVELNSNADKAYYSVKTKAGKPSDNEYEEMTTKIAGENGYSTFKASKTIYTNGTYYVYTKDSNGEIKEKTITINNIDETKPTCSFSNIEYVGLNKEATAYLTCTDIVDIKNSTVTKDILDVSDDTLVSIESISTDSRIGESAPQGEQKGYKYKIVLKGKKTGVFTLGLKSNKIEDTVGNKNERVEKTNIKVTQITADTDSITLNLTRTNTHQIEITKSYAGDLSYVSANTSIATVSTTGLITGTGIGTTTITVTESNGKATAEIEVKVEKTLDVTLQKGDNVESIGATTLSCTAKTSSGKCSITLPSITPSRGYDVDGWYEGTTKVGVPSGSYEIAENKTITGKSKAQTYTIVYDCNGGSKPSGKLENDTATYDQTFTTATDKCVKDGYTQMYWEDPTGDRSWTNWSGTWKYIDGQYGIQNRVLTLKAVYYTNVAVPTTSYCKNLTYTGSSQTLVNNAATGFSWTNGTTRTVVGNQEVTAHLAANYIWSDGTLTDKKITCGIGTKAVTYKAKNQSKTYDGTALNADSTCDITAGSLVSGHTATCTNTGSQTNAGSSAKTLTNVVIKDEDNNDVTSNYAVTKTNGTLEVNAREITVTASDQSKTYDGSALSADSTCSVTSTTKQVSGDTVVCTSTGSQTLKGSSTKTLSTVVIKNSSGTDVSSNYSITKANGTLTVNARTVTYTASNQSKTYDGTALNADSTCSITSGSLPSGHTATCTNTGSQTNVGSSTKTLSGVVIKNSAGTDVSSSFTITKNNGTLTVNARAITVTASNQSKTYDGTALNADATCSVTSTTKQVSEHTVTCTSTGSQTNAGSSAKTLSTVVIKNSSGTDVSSNYSITKANGTLTVNARATTCTAESKNVTYPGSAVTGPNGSCTNLVSGHSATFTNTGSQNGVGSTTNTLSSVVIKNSSGTDVSSNYSITKANGTLTVVGITRTATFNPNSNTLSQPSGCSKNSSTGVVTCSCTTTGTNTSCNVTSPTITAPANTPSVCGFTTSTTGASSGCTGHNASISISSNPTYYAQTYKSAITHTITFYKNGASTQTNASGTAVTDNTVTRTCTRAATYNGAAQAGTCSITSPTIVAATNFSVIGYGTSSESTSSSWNHNTAANVSANASYYAVTRRSFSASFTVKDTAAATTSATSSTCYVYNGSTATSCSVTAPTLTAKSGYTAVGWSATNGGTTKVTSFTSGNTYYSITYNNTPITITFYKNGASTQTNASGTAVTDNTVTRSCYKYNGATSCSVTSPTIAASTNTPTVVGYNTSSSGTTSGWNQNTAANVSANASWYAITRKDAITHTITFYKNGASKQTNASGTAVTDDTVTRTCTRAATYNGAAQAGTCSITSPTITAATNFSVIGYGTSSESTSSSWNHATAANVSANASYYAVTRRSFSASFTVKDTAAATTSATSATCYVYNGSTATSCSVTAPTLTAKSGYTAVGWSSTDGGTTKVTSFTSGNTYYSITYNNTPITITFYKNGASTQTNASGTAVSDNTVTRSCYRYNGSSTCSVTSPTIAAASGFSVIGYGSSSGSTSSSWNHATAKSFNSNASYYAVTRRQLSVTFSRNTTEISSIESTTGSCYVYNGGTSCTASSNSPTITANTNYISVGFFTSNTGTITLASSPMLEEKTTYIIQTGATDLANKKIQTGTTLYARGFYASGAKNYIKLKLNGSGNQNFLSENFNKLPNYVYVDGVSITPATSYNFTSGGEHKVVLVWNNAIDSMATMFKNCDAITSIDLSGFDTSNVTDMNSMFSGCRSLTSLDLSGFDTSNVIDMNSMFYGCSSLTSLDLSNFNTSNVMTMNSMFSGCSSLTSLDLSNFNTSNVMIMNFMFSGVPNGIAIRSNTATCNRIASDSRINVSYTCGP